jgi:hypothetical protein
MDDTPCLDFFCRPAQTQQRQYEALRAVFVEHQPLPAVAERFGYRYGSLRNLVGDFRAGCQAGLPPLFSPRRRGDGRPAAPTGPARDRNNPPWRTAVESCWRPAVGCAAAWPGCSCSCLC